MTGPMADSQQSEIDQKIKHLYRHRSKISLRRANVLTSSNQPPPSLIATGVQQVSNLSVTEFSDYDMNPGMNSVRKRRARLFLSDVIKRTKHRSKSKEKVQSDRTDIHGFANIADSQDETHINIVYT